MSPLDAIIGTALIVGAVPATGLIVAAGMWWERRQQQRNRRITRGL